MGLGLGLGLGLSRSSHGDAEGGGALISASARWGAIGDSIWDPNYSPYGALPRLALKLEGRLGIAPDANFAGAGTSFDYIATIYDEIEAADLDHVLLFYGANETGANVEDIPDYVQGILDRISGKLFLIEATTHWPADNASIIADINSFYADVVAAHPTRVVSIPTPSFDEEFDVGDGTHPTLSGMEHQADDMAVGLDPYLSPSNVTSLPGTNLFADVLDGTGGTGATSGTLPAAIDVELQFATDAACAASMADGALQLVFSGDDAATCLVLVGVAAPVVEGEGYHAWLDYKLESTEPTFRFHAGLAGVRLFEADDGFGYEVDQTAIMDERKLWRGVSFSLEGSGSTLTGAIHVGKPAGETVTLTIYGMGAILWQQATFAFTSADTAAVQEGAALSKTLAANYAATFSIVGGADQGDQDISGSTLRFTGGAAAPAFASPEDADTNNTYVVTIRATRTSDGATVDQTHTTTVTELTADGTPWDATKHGGGLAFTEDDYVATTTNGFGIYNAVTVASVAQDTGKYYCEVERVSGFYFVGVGDASTTGGTTAGAVYFGTNGTYDLGDGGGQHFDGPSGTHYGLNIDTDAMTIRIRVIGGGLSGPYSIAAIAGDVAVWAGDNFNNGSSVRLRSSVGDWLGTPETGFANPIPA